MAPDNTASLEQAACDKYDISMNESRLGTKRIRDPKTGISCGIYASSVFFDIGPDA
jgi:hypothetical protein